MLNGTTGWLTMLNAYFDDSGTHDQSSIVLLAGVFGTEAEMTSLERMWQKHLDRPLDGLKPPLTRFHMTDCQGSRGEFEGWSRTETDYFCHQLQTTIIDSGVSAYGIGCARKDWDDLVTGDMRAIPARALPAISAPPRPTSSAPSAQSRAKVPP
jgi:hypothetical protein